MEGLACLISVILLECYLASDQKTAIDRIGVLQSDHIHLNLRPIFTKYFYTDNDNN